MPLPWDRTVGAPPVMEAASCEIFEAGASNKPRLTDSAGTLGGRFGYFVTTISPDMSSWPLPQKTLQ